MANQFTEVPALVTAGQVLGGEITPPSMGVNDFVVRMVPGAEASPVGAAPKELTELVSGGTIPRRYATVDYAVTQHGARFGVTTSRNSGYHAETGVPSKEYPAAVFVVKHSNTVGGAATILTVGGYILTKDGASWKLQAGNGSATFPAVKGVDVIVAASNGSNTALHLAVVTLPLRVFLRLLGASRMGLPGLWTLLRG